jgi:hypothetical protein
MQQYAETFAKEPPAGMENKIWNALQGGEIADDAPKTPKVIPFQPEYRRPLQWRYAALWVALIGSMALNMMMWNRNNKQEREQTALFSKMDTMAAGQQKLAELVENYRMNKAMMADTGMQTIVMHTVLKGHPMAATVFWSKDKGEVFVSMDALPKPPKGMQYQLWVMQGGKPVDMGVLSNDMVNTPVMQKAGAPIKSGDAFAISLEKMGGNPTPTQVYVMGKA